VPIADDAWKFLLAEMDSKVKFLREVTSVFANRALYPELEAGAALPEELTCSNDDGDPFDGTCKPTNSDFEWIYGYNHPNDANNVLNGVLASFVNGYSGDSAPNFSDLDAYINSVMIHVNSDPGDSNAYWSDFLSLGTNRDISSLCDVQGPSSIIKDSTVRFCLQLEFELKYRADTRSKCCSSGGGQDNTKQFCGPWLFYNGESIDTMNDPGKPFVQGDGKAQTPLQCFSGKYDDKQEKMEWDQEYAYPDDGGGDVFGGNIELDLEYHYDPARYPKMLGCSSKDNNKCQYDGDAGTYSHLCSGYNIPTKRNHYDLTIDAPLDFTKSSDGKLQIGMSNIKMNLNLNDGDGCLKFDEGFPLDKGPWSPTATPGLTTPLNTAPWSVQLNSGSDDCTPHGWLWNEGVTMIGAANLYMRPFTQTEQCPNNLPENEKVESAELNTITHAGRIRGCKMKTNTFVPSAAKDVYTQEAVSAIARRLKGHYRMWTAIRTTVPRKKAKIIRVLHFAVVS